MQQIESLSNSWWWFQSWVDEQFRHSV